MAASKQLTEVLSQLRDVAARLESASSGDDEAKFQAATTDASLLFLELKALNRDVLEGVEGVREQTASAKKELDEKRLQLQNVLYEKTHIQKEIKTCQDFRSKYSDEEIGLCSVAEFKKKAAYNSAEVKDETDEHTLMLKRLSHELAERKKLCEQEKELKVRTNPPTNQQLKSETRCCDNRNHHHRGTGAKNERTFFSCRALASSDGGGPMRERGKRKPSSIRVV